MMSRGAAAIPATGRVRGTARLVTTKVVRGAAEAQFRVATLRTLHRTTSRSAAGVLHAATRRLAPRTRAALPVAAVPSYGATRTVATGVSGRAAPTVTARRPHRTAVVGVGTTRVAVRAADNTLTGVAARSARTSRRMRAGAIHAAVVGARIPVVAVLGRVVAAAVRIAPIRCAGVAVIAHDRREGTRKTLAVDPMAEIRPIAHHAALDGRLRNASVDPVFVLVECLGATAAWTWAGTYPYRDAARVRAANR